MKKEFNLEKRTKQYAQSIRNFIKKIPYSIAGKEDCKQLVRSSGSVGANFIEAKEAIRFIGIPLEHHLLLQFPDADGQRYVKSAIKKVIPIIKDADRIFIPSNNNLHVDHQATRDIAIGAAQSLKLKGIEYYVYFVPSYGKFQEDSKDHFSLLGYFFQFPFLFYHMYLNEYFAEW
jgi:hypothetical protein